jgi:hypothetical protein
MRKSYVAKGLTGLALIATVVAGGMLSVSAPASAAVGDWERLSAYNSGLVAAEPKPFTVNNGPVQTANYDAMAYNGLWRRDAVGSVANTYTLTNRWSNQCLDTQDGNSMTAGTPVVQEPCDGSDSQKWLFTLDPVLPVWHISNVQSGLYLAVENGSSSVGAQLVQLKTSANNTSREWQMW